MLRLTAISHAPLSDTEAKDIPRLRLPYRERVRSRLAAVLPGGEAVAIVLPRGHVLRDGTLLIGDDGARLIVEALPEPLTRVTAASAHALLRAAYHLANRHVPTQLGPEGLLIEPDPVLERMLLGLGTRVEHVDLPFEPEAGAYEGHGHSHGGSPRDELDAVSATIGEQLSIAAHRGRGIA